MSPVKVSRMGVHDENGPVDMCSKLIIRGLVQSTVEQLEHVNPPS